MRRRRQGGCPAKSGLMACALYAAAFAAPLRAESWHCRNTLEVQCHAGDCTAADDGITPLDVRFGTDGGFSVCAYTGCWDGAGTAVWNPPHLLISQAQVPWSDPSRRDGNRADVVIAFDSTDRIALVKAGSFALPMPCSPSS